MRRTDLKPSYSRRFQAKTEAQAYQDQEYAPGGYADFIWSLQKPVLKGIIQRQKETASKINLLDFACGSGRILSFVENFVPFSHGVDIAPPMIQLAQRHCRKSRLFVGDICREKSLLPQTYQIITAFRFFLNAEPALRKQVLEALHRRLDRKNGLLIANFHGNARSLRHFALGLRRRRLEKKEDPRLEKEMFEEISPAEIRRLFKETGFEIVEQYGFGLFPRGAHNGRLQQALRWLERKAAGKSLLRRWSIDLLYVCRCAG